MTDSRLLAEARIIARLEVDRMAKDLNLGRVTVYKTEEEVSVGVERVRRQIEIQKIKLNRLRNAAEEAKRTMELLKARFKAVRPVEFIDQYGNVVS